MDPSHAEYWFQHLPAPPAANAAGGAAANAAAALPADVARLRIFQQLCRRGTAAALLAKARTKHDDAMDVDGEGPPPNLSPAVLRDLLEPGPALLTSRAFDIMGLALTIMSIFMCTPMTLADASVAAGQGLQHFRDFLIHVSASPATASQPASGLACAAG